MRPWIVQSSPTTPRVAEEATRGEKAPELGNRPFFRQRDPFCEDLRIRHGQGRRRSRRQPSAFFTRSGVNGECRSRTPVSCKIALETVGAISGVAICPAPVG